MQLVEEITELRAEELRISAELLAAIDPNERPKDQKTYTRGDSLFAQQFTEENWHKQAKRYKIGKQNTSSEFQ